MYIKIIFFFSLSFFSFSGFAQDFFAVSKETRYSGDAKYIDEMKPYELESAIQGYPRCRIMDAQKSFPFHVDAVIFDGPDGKLYFLEITNPKTNKVRILHLEEVGRVANSVELKADQRTMGFGWIAKASVSHSNAKETVVLIKELSSKWQIGYSLENVNVTCR